MVVHVYPVATPNCSTGALGDGMANPRAGSQEAPHRLSTDAPLVLGDDDAARAANRWVMILVQC